MASASEWVSITAGDTGLEVSTELDSAFSNIDSYVGAHSVRLDDIEDDVTYNADTDVSGNGWVLDEDNLVSPNIVANILKDEFDGMVEKQSELIDLIMEQTGCGNRTARTGLKNALKMKVIYESPGQTGRSKSYRLPMVEQWG